MKGKLSPCKRRGCAGLRQRWQLTCEACWSDIPWPDKQRYLRAARAKLTRIKNEIGREILRALGRKPAEASPPAATSDTFTNIARLTGDRDAMEHAE